MVAEPLDWALNKKQGKEHVTLPNFVQTFGLSNKESATEAYLSLIKHNQLSEKRRKKLHEAYVSFRLLREERFWHNHALKIEERRLRINGAIVAKKAGVVIQDAGLKEMSAVAEHPSDIKPEDGFEFEVINDSDDESEVEQEGSSQVKAKETQRLPSASRRAEAGHDQESVSETTIQDEDPFFNPDQPPSNPFLSESGGVTRTVLKRPRETDVTESPSNKRGPGAESFFIDAEEDEQDQDEGDVDVVSSAESSRDRLDQVFNVEPFVFHGSLDDMDIGSAFTAYFNHCATRRYDPSTFADFLALNGILFMQNTPTPQQELFFGDAYANILATMKQHMLLLPNDEMIDEGLAVVRQYKDAYNKVVWKAGDNDQARAALEKAAENTSKCSLRQLFLHGCTHFFSKGRGALTEADLISAYILPMLACIMNKPERSRLAHTATTATTGSLFVRLCKDLGALPKHPDVIVKHQETIDIGFGEVSYSKDFAKDRGDLCRVAIWSKRAIDQLQAQHEGLDDINIPFFQVVSKDCTLYQMRRIGSISVAVELGKLEIFQDLTSLISFKEDQVFVWLKLETLFTRLLELVENAKKRSDNSKAPKYYFGLSTPSARNMPKN